MQRFDKKKFMKNVGDSYDVQFIKQVPMHPRDRLARATKNAQRDDDVEFIKQVTMHRGDDDVEFKKNRCLHILKTKALKHQRDRMNEKKLKIATENFSALCGENLFLIQRFSLNKAVLFDTSKNDEQKIIDKILENIPGDNDTIYLIHEPGTNAFSLRREDGT